MNITSVLRHTALAFVAATAAHTAQAQATVSVLIAPSVTNVAVGDSFSLTVYGKDLLEAFTGGGFDLSYDATRLTLNSIGINGGFWNAARSAGLHDPASGTVSDIFFNAFPAVAPRADTTLDFATLSFTAKAAGSALVQLIEERNLAFSYLTSEEALPVSFGSATVNISAVPEPTSLALLFAGVAVVAGVARQRRQG